MKVHKKGDCFDIKKSKRPTEKHVLDTFNTLKKSWSGDSGSRETEMVVISIHSFRVSQEQHCNVLFVYTIIIIDTLLYYVITMSILTFNKDPYILLLLSLSILYTAHVMLQ